MLLAAREFAERRVRLAKRGADLGMAAGEQRRHDGQQHAQREPEAEDQAILDDLLARLVALEGMDTDGPHPTREFELTRALVTQPLVAVHHGGLEHQFVGRNAGAVVDLDVDAVGHFGEFAPQHRLHQVAHAQGRIGPADQGRTPFRRAFQRGPVAVNGHVEQETRLHVLVGFLHQLHLSGQRGAAAGGSAFHRFPPHRLGIHVVAKGTLVTPVERFQIDDRGIGLARARRTDGVGRKALAAHARHMLGHLACIDALGETDPLDARETLFQAQAGDIGLEFAPIHLVAGREQPDHTAQCLFVGADLVVDRDQHAIEHRDEFLVRQRFVMATRQLPQCQRRNCADKCDQDRHQAEQRHAGPPRAQTVGRRGRFHA